MNEFIQFLFGLPDIIARMGIINALIIVGLFSILWAARERGCILSILGLFILFCGLVFLYIQAGYNPTIAPTPSCNIGKNMILTAQKQGSAAVLMVIGILTIFWSMKQNEQKVLLVLFGVLLLSSAAVCIYMQLDC